MVGNHDQEITRIMAGSHKERIESLENGFERLETNFTGMGARVDAIGCTVERMERMIARMGHPGLERGDSNSSSEPDGSDTSSEGEINPMLPSGRDERNKGRYKPKLTCPTFNSADPISWLVGSHNTLT